ncbi:MAG: hypothetical protein JXA25_08060 [Anaerolineales bacterium]|nr:hypothetical protein [Anaerolineales bacterium]
MFTRGSGRGRGQGAGSGRGRGQGPGRKGPFAAGPEGECVCPSCGQRTSHQAGQPCLAQKCPKCGTAMTRADAG